MIKVIFCVTLVCSALGQIQRLEPDLMTPLIRISDYSRTESQIPVSSFLEDSHFDAVSRAEQWLQDGLLSKDSIENVSSVCLNDTNTFLSALVDYEKWALRSKLCIFIYKINPCTIKEMLQRYRLPFGLDKVHCTLT